jgi:hypothetical protein
LALTPDTSESFVREVNENLHRDQMAERAKRYGGVVAGGLLLFLLAVAGYLYWQDRQRKQAEAGTEQLTGVMQDIGAGKMTDAPARLDTLRQSDADGVKAVAGLSRAALALQQGNRKLAATVYGEIAADDSLPKPIATSRWCAEPRSISIRSSRMKSSPVSSRLP